MADISCAADDAACDLFNDDPSAVMRRAIAAGEGLRGSPEQHVLAWLMSLSAERDPAIAAGNLLKRYDGGTVPPARSSNVETGRLFELLGQVAAFPRVRLSRLRPGRRRRSL